MKYEFIFTVLREMPDDQGKVSVGAFVGEWRIHPDYHSEATSWDGAFGYARGLSSLLGDAVYVGITRVEVPDA